MLSFMGDIAAKVSTTDAMPGWVVLFVKFLLDICRNIFLDVVLLQRLLHNLLHLVACLRPCRHF
uniref:Uncharacterized protein n=1 Tax=Ciona savignyi TaxID=51511 RepID=H2Z8T4_CIOSA